MGKIMCKARDLVNLKLCWILTPAYKKRLHICASTSPLLYKATKIRYHVADEFRALLRKPR